MQGLTAERACKKQSILGKREMLSEPVHNFKNTWCQKTGTFSAWHHKAASDCPVKDVGKRKYLEYMLTNNIKIHMHFKSLLQDVESWPGAILIAEPCFSWASHWEGVGPLLTPNGGLASLLSITLTFPPCSSFPSTSHGKHQTNPGFITL